ncbi:multidrug effflux MFS transporter [Saccharospirillum impatiens]|uniref:multidrug effflux MFS transporter n=1 Tax=Saccharospirillum impatiens TaxID=169438 RepID=UPI000413D6DC|nr:multidrug effflux MFS transporter [Saccharospirillum impatiens]
MSNPTAPAQPAGSDAEPSPQASRLIEFIVLFALLTSLTALTIDAILPAFPAMAASFSVTDATDLQLTISLMVLGMVFGELAFGPLADCYGRKWAIVTGLLIFTAGTLVAMFAQSLTVLLLGRLVQGIGVAGSKIGTRALIRDRFQGDAMARIMSFVMMILILVPMLAPALGQLVLWVAGWRAIFGVLLVLALIAGTWLVLRQPETLTAERRLPIRPAPLARTTLRILKHPQVMAYTVVAGLVFGCQVVYYSIAHSLFEDLYQAGARFPLYFAILAAGIGLASLTNGALVMRLGMFRQTITALIGMLVISTLLAGLAWLGEGKTSLAVFLFLGFWLFFGVGLLFGNINALAMQSLGQVAGLGSSIIASFSSLVAVAVSFAVGPFYNQTVYPLALVFFGAAAVSLVLVLSVQGRECAEVVPVR